MRQIKNRSVQNEKAFLKKKAVEVWKILLTSTYIAILILSLGFDRCHSFKNFTLLSVFSAIENLRDYVEVLTPTKNIVTKQSISSIEESLAKQNFVRIHHSFMAAINKIQSYTTEMIDLGRWNYRSAACTETRPAAFCRSKMKWNSFFITA